jgi:2-succinyl-6-hydroxy-2,4-cyclohexadiene-1-carboxylate synthase
MARELGFEVWGRGPIQIVALHGFTGNRTSWSHLEPYWAERCSVLVIDLPGHGQTPLEVAPTYEEAVEVVAELVRAQGWGDANLLGYSLGARVALGLAVREPGLFCRLVLESGSPGLRRRKARNERRREDAQLAAAIEKDGVEEFVRRWEALPLFDGLQKIDPQLQDSLRARRLEADPVGLAGSLRGLGLGAQPNYWPHLPLLRIPTLLITGAKDAKFTETARRMAAELPMVWHHAFAGVGHAPHLEVAEPYANEVLSFLSTPWIEAPLVERETGSNA